MPCCFVKISNKACRRLHPSVCMINSAEAVHMRPREESNYGWSHETVSDYQEISFALSPWLLLPDEHKMTNNTWCYAELMFCQGLLLWWHSVTLYYHIRTVSHSFNIYNHFHSRLSSDKWSPHVCWWFSCTFTGKRAFLCVFTGKNCLLELFSASISIKCLNILSSIRVILFFSTLRHQVYNKVCD